MVGDNSWFLLVTLHRLKTTTKCTIGTCSCKNICFASLIPRPFMHTAWVWSSFVPRSSYGRVWLFCTLQAIKNWKMGRSGYEDGTLLTHDVGNMQQASKMKRKKKFNDLNGYLDLSIWSINAASLRNGAQCCCVVHHCTQHLLRLDSLGKHTI